MSALPPEPLGRRVTPTPSVSSSSAARHCRDIYSRERVVNKVAVVNVVAVGDVMVDGDVEADKDTNICTIVL